MVSRFGTFQVHALHHSAPLDVEIAEDQFERDLFTGIGRGVIDLAEAAAANGPLDCVAIQRPGSGTKGVATVRWGCRVGFRHV